MRTTGSTSAFYQAHSFAGRCGAEWPDNPDFPVKACDFGRKVRAAHGLFLKHHISRVFNRQDAKYAKFPRRCLSAGGNIEFVGLGDLGVLAVGQIVKLQEKTMQGGELSSLYSFRHLGTIPAL
ncbi:MAG: hypothetical protein ACOYOU_04520 [Kiritimatiellia bacterium]